MGNDNTKLLPQSHHKVKSTLKCWDWIEKF